MRVLIVQHGIFPGYVAPVPKEWAKNLFNIGLDVSVAVIGEKQVAANGESFKFPVYHIQDGGLLATYTALREIVRRFDIVHYFPGKRMELMPLLSRKTRFIFNYLSVSVSGQPARDTFVNVCKRLQPVFADHVLFTDEALAQTLRPFKTVPISLLPVGYASELFYPCSRYPDDARRRLIYHGAVRQSRRLDELVHVLSRLPTEYTLTIIGGGLAEDEAYGKTLCELSKRLNCAARFELSNMPQTAIREVIGKSYMGVSYVPMSECYQDQFVLKTLEYLACQRPVITTATRYSKRFAEEIGPNKILLTDGSIDDMVNRICHADGYVRAFYSEENLKALSLALEPYTSMHLVRTKLLPLYKSVLT